MGIRDNVCVLSGIRPQGGPVNLFHTEYLPEVASAMASEIISTNNVSLSLHDLIDILSRALRFALPPAGDEDSLDRLPWVPNGLSEWDHWDTAIAIGYFGDEGWGYQLLDSGSHTLQWCIPTGCNVEVRRVRNWQCNYFESQVVEVSGKDGIWEQEDLRTTDCPASGPNMFLLEGCYWYLQAWLDPTLPPRLAFLDSVPSMPLMGELFEIVNSRPRSPDDTSGRLLPVIVYGDILDTWDQFQDYFLPARNGVKHTAAAISAGLRDMELLPAFIKDFQCWLFMRPDVWPSWSEVYTVSFTVFALPTSTSSSSNLFNLLPTELFLDIIGQLHLPSLLALSSTSKILRSAITEPSSLNKIIRRAISSGPLYWVLPVATVPGEVEAAAEADTEWISSRCTNAGISGSTDITSRRAARPFSSSTFPYLSFIRACFESDSMMNRKRLWDNVKQFDILWRNYRLHGWEKDVFVH